MKRSLPVFSETEQKESQIGPQMRKGGRKK